jgi:hypothetical protein
LNNSRNFKARGIGISCLADRLSGIANPSHGLSFDG